MTGALGTKLVTNSRKVNRMKKTRGGVLLFCWYTGMCDGFEVHFRHFRYIDGWVITTDQCAQIEKFGVFGKFSLKSTQFEQNLCFLWKNGIEKGRKITFF